MTKKMAKCLRTLSKCGSKGSRVTKIKTGIRSQSCTGMSNLLLQMVCLVGMRQFMNQILRHLQRCSKMQRNGFLVGEMHQIVVLELVGSPKRPCFLDLRTQTFWSLHQIRWMKQNVMFLRRESFTAMVCKITSLRLNMIAYGFSGVQDISPMMTWYNFQLTVKRKD